MNSFFRRLYWLTRRPRKESELAEELSFHLEEEAAERASEGLSRENAYFAARRELGNLAGIQEETRAAWTWKFLEDLRQDARYAFRTMRANRTFSALAVLSLALGIGANAAIFSFMDAILLRSLLVSDPQSLAVLSWHTQQAEVHGMDMHDDCFSDSAGFTCGSFAYPVLELFRRNPSLFASVFAYQSAGDLHITVGEDAEIGSAEYVTGDYFPGLGTPAAAGRMVAADDDRATAPPVAVVSFAWGQRHFGEPANVLGQSIRLNGLPFTIVGVAPPGFFGADPALIPDIYVPMHARLLLNRDRFHSGDAFSDPNYEWVLPMARLRPGVSPSRAQAVMRPQFSEWIRTVNTARDRSDLPVLSIRNGHNGLDGLRRAYTKPLFVLLALVGLILALACANIANLLLARSASRRREIAVRLSMGAGRRRVIRQLLTETVLLASIGGTAGIAVAILGIHFLTVLLASGRDGSWLQAELNWHVLAVLFGLSLATGVLFGIAPALRAAHLDPFPALKESRIAARVRPASLFTLGRVLMTSQIAISLVILVAAGLFVSTLARLEAIQLGFNRDNVLTFQLDASQAGHSQAGLAGFYGELRERFASIPGVRSASFSDLALVGGRMMTGVSVDGAPAQTSLIVSVAPDFFTTMQIPLLQGRAIQSADAAGALRAAVVNQVFARRHFAGGDALGHFLSVPRSPCRGCNFEILGVSDNALVGRAVTDEPQATIFLPYTANIWGGMRETIFELRTAGDPLAYARAVREIVHRADPGLPIAEMRTQRARIDGTLSREIVFARLSTAFALLALAIACVGLYGAMSYHVARRTGEIGIRMALGAPRGGVLWLVLREVLAVVGAGLIAAIPAAALGLRLLRSFLYQTSSHDPWSLAAATAALALSALLAGYLPARSASRIDPIAALRHE